MGEKTAEKLEKFIPSVWIAANAGSGKTRALVDRVLTLLLHGVTPERIYCITYTKAAAAEMRSRIIAQLKQLLVMDDAACEKKLAEWLGRAPNSAEMERARNLFAIVLDSPFGGMQLTTIHGFCQQILRKFPLEAGISPQFTVLEDAQMEQFRRLARLRLFDMAESSEFSDALALLAERSGEGRVSDILAAIEQSQGKWEHLFHATSPESIRTQIYEALDVSPTLDASGLREHFVAEMLAPSEISEVKAALPLLLNHKNKGEQKLGKLLSDWLEQQPTDDILEALCECFVTKKYTPKAISKSAPIPELLEKIRDRCLRFMQSQAALACAEESTALMQVAYAYMQLLRQLKFQYQSYDYHDLIRLTRELMTTHEMIGWVMRKLDHRIDHLLIDEAQDTSPDQWSIAKALVEELIATNDGLGSGDVPRSLLVVGDEKQSIFGFQGAAPEAFARERAWFQHALQFSAAPLEARYLRVSYRSANAVLQVVDAVAAEPAVARALSSVGEHAPHELHRTHAPGWVSLYAPVIVDEKYAAEPFAIPTEYAELQSAPHQLAQRIARQIKHWLDEKRVLPALSRAIRPSDILILVHRRKPMLPALIKALEAESVPVAGMDRLILSEHLAVRDLLALMRWCMHEQDDLALAHVLRSPIIGLSDKALRALAYHREGSLIYAVRYQLPALADQLAAFQSWRHLPPYDFLTQVLEVAGARRSFAQRFGAEIHEILDELKSQAAHLPERMVPNLSYFHDWLTRSERIVKRDAENTGDHVRIMTAHGSKGLEAPVVILADTTRAPDLRKELIYFSGYPHSLPFIALSDEAKEAPAIQAARAECKTALEAEYQRLLYVALTRARDELHIYAASNKDITARGEEGVECWYQTIRQAMEKMPAVTQTPEGMELRDAVVADITYGTSQADSLSSAPPVWLTASVLPGVRKPSPLSPSHLSPDAPLQAGSGNSSAERGVVMHRVLQALHRQSDAQEIGYLLNFYAPQWSADARAEALREITLLHIRENWLWEHPSRAEVTIAGQIEINGRIQPVLGQIDRLVEMPDALVIVDYKTGQPKADMPLTYVLQLKAYAALLQQIYPEKTVRAGVLWTAIPQFIALDGAIAATPWPQFPDEELMGNSTLTS